MPVRPPLRSLPLFALIACATEPSYEGRRCDADHPCPSGYECGAGTCHLQGTLQPDAQVGEDASIEEDTGPRDGAVEARVESIDIDPGSISLAVELSAQLKAAATYSDQSSRDVTKEAVWSVDDPAIAVIDAGGLLRALALGTATVSATLDGITGIAALRVKPAIVVQVETWSRHNLAVKSDGTLWGWGWNESRQLDPIAQNQITAPMQLAIDGVAWVRAGGTMTFAVKKDGTVWSWGGNAAGQLGNGSMGPNAVGVPNPVVDPSGTGMLSGVRDLRSGYDFALALMEDGTVLAWGANSFGSLGLGTTGVATPIPTPIPNLAGVTAIAAGTYHGVALIDDSSVEAWGYNDYGQLGSGSFMVHTNQPAPVSGLGGAGQLAAVVAIDAGWGHTLAKTETGGVLAWGWNVYGQLGDTTTDDRISPVRVMSETGGELAGVSSISAGFAHSFARLDDGTLMSWGNNASGQLGSGAPNNRAFAGLVLSAIGGPPFTGTSSCFGGADHGIALTGAHEVFVWGTNTNGELANGMFGMDLLVRTPVLVSGL